MVGLYGTLAQAVTRRTREIGVRMALGAQRPDVTRMILRDALILVAGGILIGVPMAWSVAQVVASFLFSVTPANPAVTIACCAVVAAVSTAAAYVPARRAARIDPLIALQQE
jgi:putative ABC transport system permease protein